MVNKSSQQHDDWRFRNASTIGRLSLFQSIEILQLSLLLLPRTRTRYVTPARDPATLSSESTRTTRWQRPPTIWRHRLHLYHRGLARRLCKMARHPYHRP